MTAYVLARLGKLCNNVKWLELSEQTILNSMKILERAPAGCGQMLLALDFLLNDTQEIVIASESPSELEQWRKTDFQRLHRSSHYRLSTTESGWRSRFT